MTSRAQVNKILPYSILVITFYSVLPYGYLGIFDAINIPFLWWVLLLMILYGFFLEKKNFSDLIEERKLLFVQFYLIWNIIEIFRGGLISENYWDWKALSTNGLALLIPIAAYAATKKYYLSAMLRLYVKYVLPMFFVFAFLIQRDAYGFYLVPISFLMFFLPVLNVRPKVIVIGFTLIVLLADFDARSNVIKFLVPVIFLSMYFFKNRPPVKLFELIRLILFIVPFLLFFLAVTNVFNVFNIQEYVEGDYIETKIDVNGNEIESNLTSDTRTLLYVEVLNTAQKYDTWLFGRSPARGNETEIFADIADITGRNERWGNEVAILNIFTWTGIVGVLLYMIVFYKASYVALNKSNNIFSKMIGLFIAFRWLYAWVEDINVFSLNTFFLWIMIGFCFSKSFREMSNIEMKIWVKTIFENKNKTTMLPNNPKFLV